MRYGFRFDSRCHAPFGRGRGSEFGPGMGFGGRGHDGFGPRGRARMFQQGDLRFVLLRLLSEKPAHGYELIRAVEERFGGAYAPSPGIVYPTLTLLEEQGMIAVVETEGPRKLFGLTDAGRAELAQQAAEVDRVFARMREMRERFGDAPPPEVVRAMDNLKAALRLKLSRGRSGEDVSNLTAILDGAARAIETL